MWSLGDHTRDKGGGNRLRQRLLKVRKKFSLLCQAFRLARAEATGWLKWNIILLSWTNTVWLRGFLLFAILCANTVDVHGSVSAWWHMSVFISVYDSVKAIGRYHCYPCLLHLAIADTSACGMRGGQECSLQGARKHLQLLLYIDWASQRRTSLGWEECPISGCHFPRSTTCCISPQNQKLPITVEIIIRSAMIGGNFHQPPSCNLLWRKQLDYHCPNHRSSDSAVVIPCNYITFMKT